MPNYDYDPSEHKNDNGGGGNLLPNGKHIVRVIDHQLSETTSGLGQVIVTFEAKDGRSRKAWLICEGKAHFQFGSLLNACGWTSKIRISASGAVKQAIYGKDVEIVVADNTYNGETKSQVKYINKAPGGFGPEGGGRREEPRDERPAPDDDIPF